MKPAWTMRTSTAAVKRFNDSTLLTLLTSLTILLTRFAAGAAEKPSGIPAGYKLQYEQSFDSPDSLKQIVFSDPKAWRHAKDGDNGALELFGKSDYNHKVRIERNTTDGTIKVYFDDLSKPIMVAKDKTFASGYVGFGSFDDKGKIDNVKVWAPTVTRKKTGFFAKPG